MFYKLIAASLAVVGLFLGAASAAAQEGPVPFTDRASFEAAADRRSTIDFEAIAPARGFGKFPVGTGLTTNGVNFRTSGGARFGPGIVYVLSASYAAPNPMYATGTGAALLWGPPNQPGNASLDVALPRGVTAVGAELWTGQPRASSVEVTATDARGRTQTVTVNTNRPAGSFVGFTSEADISSISFRPPKGQTNLMLDNFVMGRRAGGGGLARRPAPAGPRADAGKGEAQSPLPPDAQTNLSAAAQAVQSAISRPSQPAASQASQAPAISPAGQAPASPANQPPARTHGSGQSPAPTGGGGGGTIAYVRGGTEIRLVAADGSNDRRLWTHPDASEHSGINDLAWRPDGKELAFSSGHNSVVSLYHADIYGVRPDGTGLRRITNAPDHGEFARYPKGAVSVTVRNDQPIYRQTQASAGIFIVYVAGADMPQQITLPPGSSRTLLFKSVADFGNHAQPVVAVYGQHRWFMPGVDVRAGRTVTAPAFGITGDGAELLGAFRPVWRGDGSRVSYRSGLCVVSSAPAQPTPGEYIFQPLFKGDNPMGACTWDWGPTPALANQFIYSANSTGEGSSVFRIAEGGTHPGTKLWTFTELDLQLLLDLRWLPDGSGFLYSHTDLGYESANIFRYDLATKRATQVTRFEGEFARRFAVSPDGVWVVFERARSLEEAKDSDLWVMRIDGAGLRLLARDGFAPSWGR